MHRRMHAGWRAQFSAAEPYLAPGAWRVLKFRKRKPGSVTEFLLIHESSDPHSILRDVVRCDVDRYRIWSRPFRRLTRLSGRELTDEGVLTATAVLPRHSGKVLCFDLDRRLVARITSSVFTPEYERIRNTFSARVPSVPYKVLPGRFAIQEPFIDGPLMASVSIEAQVVATLGLLELFPGLIADARPGDSGPFLEEAIERTEPGDPVRSNAHAVKAWLAAAPCVPAHHDLQPVNLIVGTEGPICSDFGGVGWAPTWFDGATLTFSVLGRAVEAGDLEQVEALTAGLERFLIRTTGPGPEGLPSDWRRLIALTVRASYGHSFNPSLLEGPNAWAAVR
jgi:hypothetical protein